MIGFLLCLLSGCLYTTSIEKAQRLAGSGYPEEYYQGFADGCDSGLEKGGYPTTRAFRKDYNAYALNKIYRSGWDDGINRCYNDAVEHHKKVKESMEEEAIRNYLYEKNRL